METTKPLITIIVPVYNVEKYLRRCVESIVHQTYMHLEIILINDGSTDGSDKICDFYHMVDNRVKVLHKENEGLSQTRNMGIEMAHGKYVLFVDSDDWIDNNMCEALVDALENYGADVSMCTYMREYQDKSLPRYIYNNDMQFEGREFLRKLCGLIDAELRNPEKLDSLSTVCTKLYPSNIIKNIKFLDTNVVGTEDLLFNIEVFSKVNKTCYINMPFYHYNKINQISTTHSYKKDLLAQWKYLFEKIEKILDTESLSEEYYIALDNRRALSVLGLGLNCFRDNASINEKYFRLNQIVKDKELKDSLRKLPLNWMPVYWKVFYFFARYGLTLPLCVLIMIIKQLKGKI